MSYIIRSHHITLLTEHREKIARELLDTERSYVGHLNVLIEVQGNRSKQTIEE